MNFPAAMLPTAIELRLALVVCCGLILGPTINWIIYNAAYFSRPISPWGRSRFRKFEKDFPAIKPLIDRTSRWGIHHLPIVGWWSLKNESPTAGKLFWLRPMLIELGLPIFLAWLYWYEVTGGLLPRNRLPVDARIEPWLHVQYLSHALLTLLMCAATFIDFDERTIPDWITIPGTILGLIGSIVFADWHFPIDLAHPTTKAWPTPLAYDAPRAFDSIFGLKAVGLVVFVHSLWCFALSDRCWITRHGYMKAFRYFLAKLVRSKSTTRIIGLWLSGMILLPIAWFSISDPARQSLLSSVIGMLIGGLTVWLVRWTAGLALGVEALGFGDVTLMVMVGAFLGWQPTVMAFFLAPLTAMVFVLIRYVITRDNQTPFGPYLCAGTLMVVLAWDALWNRYFQNVLEVVGPSLFGILFAALALMGVLLWIWRAIKRLVVEA
jgi:prepilin signal peptidase PulO-like enzyme (type II secretory pathway)